MKQNINLYRGRVGRIGFWSTPQAIALAWVAVGLALGVTQWRLDSDNEQTLAKIERLRSQAEEIESQLNAATAATMAGSDSGLETELNEALGALALSEKIAALLRGNSAGDVSGFSPKLRSLARQHTDGIWLTHVRVAAPDGRTSLEGRALSPESVPVYLRQLSVEPALAGQRFDVFQIERPDENDAAVGVRFALNRNKVRIDYAQLDTP